MSQGLSEAGLNRIGIVGAGAWGTALAALAAEKGPALLWARDAALADRINATQQNEAYLPGIALPTALRATGDLAGLLDCDALLLAMPAQHARHFAAVLGGAKPLVLTCKGIEIETGKLLAEAVAEAAPGARLAVLTGPTFAAEVARGLPTAATLASTDAGLAQTLAERLGRPTFRLYTSDDMAGSQIGGAVKNVLAIACGIVIGRRLGDNARAALITRGLAEMARLGQRLGARPETLMGLSGLGDLVLTCSGPQSRNLSLGIALGEGQALNDYLAGRRSVAEGMYTAEALHRLCARLGLEMPIAAAVYAILHDKAEIDATIAALLARPLKME